MTDQQNERCRSLVCLYGDAGEVAHAATEMLLDAGREATDSSARHFVALSGGSTPKAMYAALREKGAEAAELLRPLHFFFGDERSVDNWHGESNVRLAMEEFAIPLHLPLAHFYPPDGGAPNLDGEAARLTSLMKAVMPMTLEGVPRFNLVFLGMGEDGHTASLFPGTRALDSKHAGYVHNEVPQLRTQRLTLTYPVINAAARVAILVTGSSKARMLGEIFSRKSSRPDYPVERLETAEILWLVDRAAAAEIPPEFLGARPK